VFRDALPLARPNNMNPLKFNRGVRVRSREEFTVVQQRGRRVATRHLTVLGLPNALGRDRLGIIASRRFGSAVTRNRAKRRLREMFRRRGDEARPLSGPHALDLVVIPRREFAEAPFAMVEQEFLKAINRLRPARPL
jgi:ribonuclease P protein component